MDNSNQLIASRLEEIANNGKYSKGMSEALLSYGDKIKRMKVPLTRDSDMKGFGIKAKGIIRDVIEELSSQEEDYEDNNEDNKDLLEMFSSIYGVSEKKAEKYIAKGYTSPQDLLIEEDLSDETRNYIRYYNDFHNAVIPREELVFFYEEILINIFDERAIEIVGGYRRGLDASDKIEIIVKNDYQEGMLSSLVQLLIEYKYVSKHHFKLTNREYNGVAKIFKKSPFRHITITVIDPPVWGVTLLMKTGNDNFINKLKRYASNTNITIKDTFLVKKDGKREIIIYPEHEEDIFEELDIEYVEAKDRESKRITFTPLE